MAFDSVFFFNFIGMLIFTGVFILIFFIAMRLIKAEQNRIKELEEAALKVGFQYSGGVGKEILNDLKNFNLFKNQYSSKIRNTIKGKRDGIDFALFEYTFTTSGSKSTPRQQTVTYVKLNDFSIPSFILKPENILHKIGSLVGFKDIDFGSNPKFSKNYFLKGKDVEAVKGLFIPDTLHFFEIKQIKFIIECDGNSIIMYQMDKRVKPTELQIYLDEVLQVIRVLKKD